MTTSDIGRWAVAVEEKNLCIRILCNLPYLSFFSYFLGQVDVPLINFCCWVGSYILLLSSVVSQCFLVKLDL